MSTIRCRNGIVLLCAALTVLLAAPCARTENPRQQAKPHGLSLTAEETAQALQRGLELLFNPIERLRETSARAKVSNNLRQLALAAQNYQEAFPGGPAPPSWSAQLLPFLEPNDVYRSVPIQIYTCPSDPWLGNRFGARIEPVPPVLASHLALPKDQGQVIGEIEKGKAADKAGLRQHDILLKLNGKDVPRDAATFAALLLEIKTDKAVDAVVLREGKRVDVKGLILTAATGAPWDQSDYARAADTIRWVTPKTDISKWIIDGTSNTINLGEQWGGPPAAREGWKVWSKGDPVLATTFRAQERFTTRHQEGSLVLTVVGTLKEGKTAVGGITVREGTEEKKYDALDKVPAEYRDKVVQLIELSAK